ncbi:MAG: glycosyltransferase family 4 protein [bacterium]|nr:glycosyltransferase family 4 protein [bacterium]
MNRLKRKILFLVGNYEPVKTGGEKYHFEVIRALRNAGYDVKIHTEYDLPDNKRYGAAAWSGYRELFAETPDYPVIVTAHGMHKRQLPALRYARNKLGTRIITVVHHLIHPLKSGLGAQIEKQFEKQYLHQADYAITNSEFTTGEVTKLGFDEDKISIVYPGINPIVPRSAIPDNDIPRLLSVGFLGERKGYHVLVKALAGVEGDFRYDIAGDTGVNPDYAESLRKLITDMDLTDRVNLRGYVDADELEALKEEADVFVMPTLHEGFGIAALEAAAYGLPVITSAAGAIPELFTDYKNALLVKPGDSLSLREAILRLIMEKELRVKLAEAGPQIPFARRSWDEVGEDFVAALNTIFGRFSNGTV